MPRSYRVQRDSGQAAVSYLQVATTLRFDVLTVSLPGPPGTSYTNMARVYDQFGVLMSPQTGTISYAADSPSVVTVGGSSGSLTSVADGISGITASWYT